MSAEQLTGLQLAVKLLAQIGNDDSDRAIAAVHAAARADTQAAALRTVERWANHHARKPATTAEEALGVIQHHPAIRAITASYADGVVPDTPDPYAEIERLQEALRATASDLFYQIESKHGPRAASEYPSIVQARKALEQQK